MFVCPDYQAIRQLAGEKMEITFFPDNSIMCSLRFSERVKRGGKGVKGRVADGNIRFKEISILNLFEQIQENTISG